MYRTCAGGARSPSMGVTSRRGDMGGKHVRVVHESGNEIYERIWEQVRHGAVLSVEFSLAGDGQMLAVTTVVDGHGVTVDQSYVEM
jgi:hypothetical protein